MATLQAATKPQQARAPMRNAIQCGSCWAIYESQDAVCGKGREHGQHPEHRYCPKCNADLDWYGWRYVTAAEQREQIRRELAALRGQTAVA